MSLAQETMTSALNALRDELEKDPISPEKVTALANVIKTLSEINPLLHS